MKRPEKKVCLKYLYYAFENSIKRDDVSQPTHLGSKNNCVR